MSYDSNSDGPMIGCVIVIIAMVLAAVLWLFLALAEHREAVRAANTPPEPAMVATVNSGAAHPGSPEATGRYVVETLPIVPSLRDAQVPLVAWIADHPDLRLVEVIPLGGGVDGITNGLIIVAEARQP